MNHSFIKSNNAPAPVGAYNQAIIADGTLYISGQIAASIKDNTLVGNNIQAQTIGALNNIGQILKEAKMTFKDVMKVTIFLRNIDDYTSMEEVYKVYFPNVSPALSVVAVSALPKNALIQIDAIAKIPKENT